MLKTIRVCFIAISLLLTPAFALGAETVDINKADKAALIANLSGIGEVRARAIVDYRKRNGPFKNIEDLQNVPGIGKALIKKNRRLLSLRGGLGALGSTPDTKKSTKSSGSSGKKSSKKTNSTSSSNAPAQKSTEKKSASKKKSSASKKTADTSSSKAKKSKPEKKSKKKSGNKKPDNKKSNKKKKAASQ